MEIITFINVAKYVVAAIGLIGLIFIIIGARKKNKEMLQYGLLTLIASATLFVCGYFIFKETVDKANNYIDEYFYYNQ
ncbi:MAG: hypothetical protein LBR34_02270 [Prevotella sp.]|jgi:hypothetical protein|nr:hypothetical protein [Prevotella sp.]